jgi:hypothetical protein
VGTLGGENYSSLSNAGGLFNAINSLGVNGNIIVKITSNLNETGTNALNSWAGGFSIMIVPSSASLKTITYTGSCGAAMLRFMGTDNLIVDGRQNSMACAYAPSSGNFLRFVSSCNQYPVMMFDGDCQNVTLRNINIASDNSVNTANNGGAINVRANQTNGSDNFQLRECLVEDFSATPDLFFGLQVNAPSVATGILTGLYVHRNNFHNVNCKGVMLTSNSGNINGSEIRNNHFYATSAIPGPGTGWEYTAIELESGSAHIVRANWVGGQAASCAGGKLNVLLSGGSELVVPLRVTSSVATSTVNQIDSNIIRNISITGANNAFLSSTMIRLEGGNNNVGSVFGNTIGDLTVDASTQAGASVVYIEGFSSANNTFRGIYATSAGVSNIENNCIGGILLEQTTALGNSTNMLYSSTSRAHFRYNFIGGVSNNIVKKSIGNFRAIYSDDTNQSFDIRGNTISGITTSTAYEGTFYAIRATAGSGAPSIIQNTVTNIYLGPANLQPRMVSINVENPSAITTSNSVSNVTVNSSYAGSQFYGVDVSYSPSSFLVNYNYVTNITLQTNSAIQTNVIPINMGGSSSTFSVFANYVSDIVINSTSNNSYVRGISITNATQNRLQNNVVLLSNGNLTNDIFLYGIYDDASAGTNYFYHNTIDIRGNATGTTRRSSCFYRNNSCTRNIQNNIFNNRRTGGSGGHYAEYHNSTGGTTTSNYNLLYVEDNTGRIARYSSDRTFTAWQGLGFDASGVTGLTPQNLVNATNGMQTTILGNDIGNTALGVAIDCQQTARPLGTGYDMGAYELATGTLVSPLPIELVSFEATCSDKNVLLNWTTASEHNAGYFMLQKSDDAYSWIDVAKIPCSKISTSSKNYSYLHPKPDTDDYYYRLKMIDLDGAADFSKIVFASCNTMNEQTCISAGPNPCNGNFILNIQCKQNNLSSVDVIDNTGRLVTILKEFNFHTKESLQVHLEHLAQGVYLLNCHKGEETIGIKLIISKN